MEHVITIGHLKICGCGMVHFGPPTDQEPTNLGHAIDGWYWNCDCGSTLFFPKDYFNEAGLNPRSHLVLFQS